MFSSLIKKNWYLFLLIPALAVKINIWHNSHPVLEGRAMSYVQPAMELCRGSYSGVETFRRPPGYPVFLAAVFRFTGENAGAITLFQHLLGTGTAFIAMRIVMLMWGSPVAAAVAGTIIALNPNLVFYESGVESETLGIFLLSLAMLFLIKLFHSSGQGRKWALAAGFTGSAAALCRPEMAAFVLVPLPFLFGRAEGLRAAICFLPAFMSPLLLWMVRNWVMFGLFTLTPMGAITSLQTSGPFVDWGSPAHGELKKVYSELLRENGGRYINVISEAVYKRGTMTNFNEALIDAYQLGVETFRAHPFKYLSATRANFMDFLRNVDYVRDEKLNSSLKFLLENFLPLAAAGFTAAAILAPGRDVLMLAMSFFCLLAANCLVDVGIPRRSIAVIPVLAVFASYLVLAPAALAGRLRAKFGDRAGDPP